MKIRCFTIGHKLITFKPGRPVDIKFEWVPTSAKTLRAAKNECRKRYQGLQPDVVLMVGIVDPHGLGPWCHSVASNKAGSEWSDYDKIKDFEFV